MTDIDKEESIVQLKQEAASVVEWAKQVSVTCQSDADAVLARLSTLATIKKRWVDYWKPIKEKAKSLHADICAKENVGTSIITEARTIAEGKLIAWQRSEQEKAMAEQRRLQAIVDEQSRKERERLEKEAAKLKTPEKREERMAQAQAVVAQQVTITAPNMNGTRLTWKAEVVDVAALIAAATPGSVAASFLSFNQSAADSFARSTKGNVAVPGIKFEAVQSLSVRTERTV